MTEESKEIVKPKKISILSRILYLFGALMYLGITCLMILFASTGLGRLVWKEVAIYGALFGTCIIGAGVTSFIFGRRIFISQEHRRWKNKTLITTATLSLILSIYLSSSYPSLTFGQRAKESDMKYNLHQMFLACQYYWEEEGDDKICDHNIASQQKYGYIQSKAVSIIGKGAANDFTATAHHEKSPKGFFINAEGIIAEVKNP